MPLSSQQDQFFQWMYESAEVRDAGNIGVAIRVRDELDPELLERSLHELVRRHESLRTVFAMRDGGPVALVLPDSPPEFAVVAAAGEEEALALARDARARLIDIARGPLTRGLVVHMGPDHHVVVVVVHHMVFDGFSMGVLLRELGLVYSALSAGQPSPLAPLPVSCSAFFASARRQWPRTSEFWRRTLAGAPTAIEPFPGRAPTDRFTRRSVRFRFDPAAANRLRAAARASACTPFMLASAGWSAVLAAWSGVTDIVLMSPVPGRPHPDLELLVGCLVQSLLFRVDAGGDPPFAELLARVRATALAALDNQLYPYADFWARFPHAPWVRYESWAGSPHFPGLESEAFELPRELLDENWLIPGGDLGVPELAVVEQPDDAMECWLVYNRFAFEPATVERLAEAFERLVGRAMERPALRLSELVR